MLNNREEQKYNGENNKNHCSKGEKVEDGEISRERELEHFKKEEDAQTEENTPYYEGQREKEEGKYQEREIPARKGLLDNIDILNVKRSNPKTWGARSADNYIKLEQVGEGTFG